MPQKKSKPQNLLQVISSEESLLEAWKKLNKTNPDSYGVSGENITSFEKNLKTKIPSISKKLLEGKYKFSPTRAVAIKKKNGKFRPLQVPEIDDRVVIKSLAMLLEKKLEPILLKSQGLSFAYQKNLSVRDAIQRMITLYDLGYTIILEADIINFFGEVNKEELITNKIFPLLQDETINTLLRNSLSQEVEQIPNQHLSLFNEINKGIPQGNALSPLLSNFYLSSFDQEIKKRGLQLIRYADDFIIMCKSKKEALNAYDISKNYLESKLDLRLHPIKNNDSTAKTRIVDPTKESFSFLSIEFDGETCFPSKSAVDNLKEKIDTITKQSKSVLELLRKTNNVLDGWLSFYYFTKVERSIDDIEFYLNWNIYKGLKKFKWRFSKSVKKRKKKREILSDEQRISSGIQFCKDILAKKRKIDDFYS